MTNESRELLARIGTALYEPDALTRQDADALYDALDALVAEVECLRAERDHFRKAWSSAQVRIDCGRDAAEALRDERSAVVAWLRTQRLFCTDSTGTPNAVSATYAHAAEAIERGEHRREEDK